MKKNSIVKIIDEENSPGKEKIENKNNKKLEIKDISNNSESTDKFLKDKENLSGIIKQNKIENEISEYDEEDKFIKENHDETISKKQNENKNKNININKINIFKSQNIEFILTGSKKNKVECIDEGTNTSNNNRIIDNTLEIERKINVSYKNSNNSKTAVNHKGNLFRTNSKENRFNKKFGTMREKNDGKIMLLIESNNSQKNKVNKNENEKNLKKKEHNKNKVNDDNNIKENN